MRQIFIVLFFLCSCSYFEEEEVYLQGKREEVFKKKEEKLIRSKQTVKLPDPLKINEWPIAEPGGVSNWH